MVELILVLLMVVIVELAVMVGLVIWRVAAGGRAPGEAERTTLTAPAAEAPEKSGQRAEEARSEDFERRWRDGMDAMLGYDINTARRAVKSDGDQEI